MKVDFPCHPPKTILRTMVVMVGALLGVALYGSVWQFLPDGTSRVSGGTAYWDFSNLWFGSRLVLEGHANYLFDPDLYRQALRQAFFQSMANQEWSYPPSMLIIGTPLALMPIGLAYAVWSLGTVGLLFLALRTLPMRHDYRLAILLSPTIFINAALGQNGALTAALFIAGLSLLERRPLLAGVFIGLLTIKPHLGILLPVVLLAGRHYRAFLSALVTTSALLLLTAVFWGDSIWLGFWQKTMPLMSAIMQAPFPQPYQSKALTIFVMVRSWNLDLTTSYLIQGGFLLAAVVLVWRIWRPSAGYDGDVRLSLTALLLLFSTPYGYIYDSLPVAVAAMMLKGSRVGLPSWLFAVLWLMPLIAIYLNSFGIMVSILIPAAAILWVMVKYRPLQDVASTLRSSAQVTTS